ncbi:MAG: histidine--tRNA ligase [Acidobacteriota bacterium]|jgi:histidyl-tRNA synthetase|nr:histidine--tRNA ligase [Acidobacteriota bacterium]
MGEFTLGNLPGTRDLLPEDTALWQFIEETARTTFGRYGFSEIRTPIIEPTELFARSIGADTDIVGKEMYTFRDQSDRSVTLRPEGTASVMRAYIQNTMYREGGLRKLYYHGPMFRHEKKQKGRWRQFFQVGAEAIGAEHPAVDAEIIEMAIVLLERLGIKARLLVNSVGCHDCRPRYVELLRERLQKDIGGFCEDCCRRADTNPLRVLDCKIASCQPLIAGLPVITDHLCEDCSAHFTRLRAHLDDAGIAYEIVPRLVRGLDYYVRTAFEIVSGDLGSQNALAGGGRYDGLSEILGGPAAPAIGFALGLDRLAMLLGEQRAATADDAGRRGPELFLAWMGDAAFDRALVIARLLRGRGHHCYVDFGEGRLKSQMRLANKLGAQHVLIIGEDELAREKYSIKRFADSQQWEVTLSELKEYLAANSKRC